MKAHTHTIVNDDYHIDTSDTRMDTILTLHSVVMVQTVALPNSDGAKEVTCPGERADCQNTEWFDGWDCAKCGDAVSYCECVDELEVDDSSFNTVTVIPVGELDEPDAELEDPDELGEIEHQPSL